MIESVLQMLMFSQLGMQGYFCCYLPVSSAGGGFEGVIKK